MEKRWKNDENCGKTMKITGGQMHATAYGQIWLCAVILCCGVLCPLI